MKRIRKFFLIGLILMVLASCSHGYWYKAGATEQEYAQDEYQCRYDANALRFRHFWDANSWFEYCMKSKGYQWRKD